MKTTISIITPVFNRAESVIDSVRSSIVFLSESDRSGEIIVVDDASTDGSAAAVSKAFEEQIASKLVRVIVLQKNLGPTGAKQIGAENARYDWLIFMDSDDLFQPGAARAACIELESLNSEHSLVFFRCVTRSEGKLIGPVYESVLLLDLRSYIRGGTPGECLPAVRRDCLLAVPYSINLRGFEGLTYAQLIRHFGPACVSPIILRRYCTDDVGERLSTRHAVRRRGCILAKGYIQFLMQFGFELRGKIFKLIPTIAYHSFNCIFNSTLRKLGIQK